MSPNTDSEVVRHERDRTLVLRKISSRRQTLRPPFMGSKVVTCDEMIVPMKQGL